VAQPGGLWQKFRNTPWLAAGIGILAFRQLSGTAAFHKIVTRFYSLEKPSFLPVSFSRLFSKNI
jgi:hypothetical protein